jgi:hypothetical protein
MPTGSARTGAGWSRIAKLAPISPVPIARVERQVRRHRQHARAQLAIRRRGVDRVHPRAALEQVLHAKAEQAAPPHQLDADDGGPVDRGMDARWDHGGAPLRSEGGNGGAAMPFRHFPSGRSADRAPALLEFPPAG